VLLELATLPQVPRTNCVVQAPCPQLASICRNVNTGGSVGVPLKLSHKRLIVQIPNGNISITATTEADLESWRVKIDWTVSLDWFRVVPGGVSYL
jgi:hypothetical protein